MLTSLLEKCVLAIIRQFEPRFCCSWASVSFSRQFLFVSKQFIGGTRVLLEA